MHLQGMMDNLEKFLLSLEALKSEPYDDVCTFLSSSPMLEFLIQPLQICIKVSSEPPESFFVVAPMLGLPAVDASNLFVVFALRGHSSDLSGRLRCTCRCTRQPRASATTRVGAAGAGSSVATWVGFAYTGCDNRAVCVDGLGGSAWWLQQTAWAAERRGDAGSRAAYTPTELYSDAEDNDSGGMQATASLRLATSTMQVGNGVRQHESSGHAAPSRAKEGVEELPVANAATPNADAANSVMALERRMHGGAPSRMGDGTAQHPDAICFDGAIWASLGDPAEALAWGGA